MKQHVILATIPSDSHCWNLVFMELLLIEQGFDVTNLGMCTPLKLILKHATENDYPSCIVISSVNGHAYIEAEKLILQLRKHLPSDIPIFIGGKMSTDIRKNKLYSRKLEKLGFTKAYSEYDDISDLKIRLEKLAKPREVLFKNGITGEIRKYSS